MNPNLCIHEEDPASSIQIYGSRLILCRICWGVIDPLPRPAGLRTPISARQEIPVIKPELAELLPLMAAAPVPAATTVIDSPFKVPVPRRRLMTAAFLPRIRFMSALIILPFAIFGILHYLMYFPSFEEYTAPSKQYTVLFPDTPIWAGGSAGGSDGEVTRHFLGSTEVYRVHVSSLHQFTYGRIRNLNSSELVQYVARSQVHDAVRMRNDVLFANAAVEYERWIDAKRIVGRIIVVNEMVYELTILGPNLSLGDSRVQRFFDSFRLETLPIRADFKSQPVLSNMPAMEQQKSAPDSRKDE
jgi:hypothetical protein